MERYSRHKAIQIARHDEHITDWQIAGRAFAAGKALARFWTLRIDIAHQCGPVGQIVAEHQPTRRGLIRPRRYEGHEAQFHLIIEERISCRHAGARRCGGHIFGKEKWPAIHRRFFGMFAVIGSCGNMLVAQIDGHGQIRNISFDRGAARRDQRADPIIAEPADETNGIFARIADGQTCNSAIGVTADGDGLFAEPCKA